MPSVYIKTYGCQMNERDSEAVAAQLVAKGYTLATGEGSADVVLINTCSVRDTAEQKALGKMETLAGTLRDRRPAVVLGFMGCMAQSRGRELMDRVPDVDLVLGTQKFHRAGELLEELLSGRRSKVVETAAEPRSEASIREHLMPESGGARSVSAFVSIMQGCNQHCTFCIVPHTRGAERSRTIEEVVDECRELAARGVKEVTLLGQIVTSYGRREIPARDGRSGFVQLLDAVHAVEGIERIRFTSPHPKGYGPDLVEAFARLPKLMESAHVPVQSGSDRVLRLMHRGYTRSRFVELATQLRAAQPGMGLTTDIIVGFPGESEEDFAETLSLYREVEFDNAFIFKYSPRRDTPAATMPCPVPAEVIDERHARLLSLCDEVRKRKLGAMVGRRVEILVEGASRRNHSRMQGRTRCNNIVVFEGSPRHKGQVMDVRVTAATLTTLYADPAIHNPD